MTIGERRCAVVLMIGILGMTSPAQGQTGSQPPQQRPATRTEDDAAGPLGLPTQGMLLDASTLIGIPVRDAAGQDVGKVHDLLINVDDGYVAYAVVATGGLLGVGEKRFGVPWEALTVAQDRQGLILAAHRVDVSKAPALDRARASNGGHPGWEERIRRYWSDAVITQTVKRDLAREDIATLLAITVSTERGVVNLSGAVKSEAEKQRAGQVARRVSGVVRVVNNLTAPPPGQSESRN